MSNATVAVAAKAGKDDIPFNPKVHYKKKASDWVIDVIIWLLLALVVIAVLYPLWFVIISSFSSPNGGLGCGDVPAQGHHTRRL